MVAAGFREFGLLSFCVAIGHARSSSFQRLRT